MLLKKAECPINVAVIAFLPSLSKADGAFSLLLLLDEKTCLLIGYKMATKKKSRRKNNLLFFLSLSCVSTGTEDSKSGTKMASCCEAEKTKLLLKMRFFFLQDC